ncbi:hypothetical protein HDU96_003661 [Phlyctochytrium bullatum]|nr:hypothetical protein HDU96_003661 [Phlyctochytrium bullatum]
MKSVDDCAAFYGNKPISSSTLSSTAPSSFKFGDPSTQPSGDNSSTFSSPSSPPIAAIAGGVTAALVLVAIVFAVAVAVYKRRRAANTSRGIYKGVEAAPGADRPQQPAASGFANTASASSNSTSTPSSTAFSSAATVVLPAQAATKPKDAPEKGLFLGLRSGGDALHPQSTESSLWSSSSYGIDGAAALPPSHSKANSVKLKPKALPGADTFTGGANAHAAVVVARWTPAQVSEKLMEMGVGAALVAALEDNGVDGARLLALNDTQLADMGINQPLSRRLILQAAQYIVEGAATGGGSSESGTGSVVVDGGADDVEALPRYG